MRELKVEENGFNNGVNGMYNNIQNDFSLVFEIKNLNPAEIEKITKGAVLNHTYFSECFTDSINEAKIDERISIVRNDNEIKGENKYTKYWHCYIPSIELDINAEDFSIKVVEEKANACNWLAIDYGIEINPTNLKIVNCDFTPAPMK